MRYGMFLQPSHPPERAIYDSLSQDLEVIDWADELGFSEVWIGEHLTAAWEPFPACDLIIAQALQRTREIKVCAGAYVLPFYHPAAVATRIMMLDHMAQGRFMLGIAAGSIPTDLPMIGLDPAAGLNRDMMRESLEIILKIFTEHVGHEWVYEGKYWTVTNPAPFKQYGPHLRPFQQPHPPIAIAGLSPRSETIRYAGAQGYIPMSLTFNTPYLKDHWVMMEEGAAGAGRTCDRRDWRVIRDVFVAETDEQARTLVREGLQARHWNESNFPLLREFDWVQYLKHDPDVPDDSIDIDYLIEHLWLVGSPDTVTERLIATYDDLGGFGTLVVNKYDWGDDPPSQRRSMELLAEEVIPNFEKARPEG
jgi:alkanesulfonate monooxygenase SsuD/methylene tetrahydromethanopterin reductase-like flavin-dependent oxidoreductase (luciferase family)